MLAVKQTKKSYILAVNSCNGQDVTVACDPFKEQLMYYGPGATDCCRIQVFHCLKHEGTGGRTLLVDGFYSAEKLRQRSPEHFELLAQVPISHEYIEDTEGHENHMKGIGPVLNTYPWNNELYLIRCEI